MNQKEIIINVSSEFLGSNPSSRIIRWVMVVFLLFCGVSQKTVAAITNYTDRQVRNIRDQFENSNGDFPRGEEKRGRKKKIKKKSFGRIVKYIMDHPRSTLKDVTAFLKERGSVIRQNSGKGSKKRIRGVYRPWRPKEENPCR
jgi:transposase